MFGLRLWPFASGAIAAAALAASLAGAAGYLVHVGRSKARTACQADKLQAENDTLSAQLADRQRAIALINGIAECDPAGADAAEAQLRNNQANIDATPRNPLRCFPCAAAGRVRSVR